jgi:hypothetical protein
LTTLTPEKEAVVLDALREKPVYNAAARKARVTRQTLHNWRKADPGFAERCEQARADGFDAVEDALITRAVKDDTTAAIFMLKSWRPERYGDKAKLEVTGKDGAPLFVVFGTDDKGPA